MEKFYFTFGSDPLYPHGMDEFVEVEAEDMSEARKKFLSVYPPRPGRSFLNCAFVYSEKEFNGFRDKYYSGKKPARTID